MADVELKDQSFLTPYTPPAFTPPATISERATRLLAELRKTPERAAVSTLATALTIIGLLSLRPVGVNGVDDGGGFKARCGASIYVFGHNSARVQQTCRDAYAGRASVLLVCVIGLLACSVALVALLARPVDDSAGSRASDARLSRRLSATPGRAALLTANSVLLVVMLFSLVPVRVHGYEKQRAFTAQCGVSSFASAQDSAIVDRACRDAYGGHALILFGSAVAFAAGAVALGMSSRAERQE